MIPIPHTIIACRDSNSHVCYFLMMQRPVLIIIDMVNDFLAKWAPAQKQQLVRSINELVGVMRQHGHPIIWVRQEFDPDLHDAFPEMRAKGIQVTIKGTTGCQIDSELAIAPSDPVVARSGTALSTTPASTRYSIDCSPTQLSSPESTRTPVSA
jgi:nicotinamidase-related amidase